MNVNIIKFFIISILLITISCQDNNESVIEIKKSIKSLNDSRITGYISLKSININDETSVELEAHLFGLTPG